VQALAAEHGREAVVAEVRSHLDGLRADALKGSLARRALGDDRIAVALARRLRLRAEPRLRPVFNLTGTVLHTNFGRALLPPSAVTAVLQAMTMPVNLEFDLESGRRGERDALIEELVCELTGAEAATVVNNNAAAVVLLLNGLAHRREVLVSRGELIEIGGSFRMPDIMRQAGVRLVEVGTTNRTHLADYEAALGSRTALIMKVHPSNFAISGFTSDVGTRELAGLAHAHGVPLCVDLGSGALVDLKRWHLPEEPVVRDVVAAGADLVTFSGDKLLGGPQAGLLVGRSDLIQRLRRNPLKRALRAGKLTLAALEAVLRLYRAPESLAERLTTLSLLTRPVAAIAAQAERIAPQLAAALGPAYRVVTAPLLSQIGSGALPLEVLPSHGFRIGVAAGARAGTSIERLGRRLRALPRPIIGRTADGALWLDLRCLDDREETAFATQLRALAP
jgi:L-seryl-tRNA(Ser) seleniumtransferase